MLSQLVPPAFFGDVVQDILSESRVTELFLYVSPAKADGLRVLIQDVGMTVVGESIPCLLVIFYPLSILASLSLSLSNRSVSDSVEGVAALRSDSAGLVLKLTTHNSFKVYIYCKSSY